MSTAPLADAALRHIASALGAPCRRRSAGRDHRRQLRSRQSGLARRLRPPAGTRARRLLSAAIDGARLCPARHHGRDPADGHRSAARGRSDVISGVSGHGARCCHAARLGHGARSGALAGRDGQSSFATLHAPVRCPRTGPHLRHAPVRHRGAALRSPRGIELAYETVDWKPAEGGRLTEALYEAYGFSRSASPARSRIRPSSCSPPRWPRSRRRSPTYRPHLPANVVADGLLSDAQLESVIYAGEAHSRPSRRILDRRRDLRRRLRGARR